MAGMTQLPCSRCGLATTLREEKADRIIEDGGAPTFECEVCRSLGGRALVPLLKARGKEREAALVAFRASPPGSVLFNAGLMRRGVPQYGYKS